MPDPRPEAPGFALEALNLTVLYGERRALDNLSLDVPAGGVFGLLGPNGSGKSTFVTTVAAMDPPPGGQLRILGRAPSRGLRRRVGVVFQEPTLDPAMDTAETLRFSAKMFGHSTDPARPEMLLDRLGLADRAHDAVSSLSGGMRRRLEVARALVHDPDLLLLDEPTTGVDAGERRQLWEHLLDGGRTGRTILLATNDLAEADSVCDSVAFLREGRVVATGTPAALKRDLRREAIRLDWPDPSDRAIREIGGWPGVGAVTLASSRVHLSVDVAAPVVARLFTEFPGEIQGVAVEGSTLEDAYFHHVGRRTPAERARAAVEAAGS